MCVGTETRVIDCQIWSHFVPHGSAGRNTAMVAGFYCCMVIRLGNFGWIRYVCVTLSMTSILMKEITQECPEWVISEVVGVGGIGRRVPSDIGVRSRCQYLRGLVSIVYVRRNSVYINV